MQLVPVTSASKGNFTCVLGDTSLDFATRWNELSSVWTMDLTRTDDGQALLRGIPLVLGADLLAPYGLGLGSLILVDTSGAGMEAGPEDLGDRVVMYYLTVADVEALRA
jgi:hypothetical protein